MNDTDKRDPRDRSPWHRWDGSALAALGTVALMAFAGLAALLGWL